MIQTEKGISRNDKVMSALNWYQKNRDFYKRLALKVELIIKEILVDCDIPFHSVTSRAKDFESFQLKASKDKYQDPKSEILDLAGIRITAYVESDVSRICEVIEKEFSIIEEHSVNKSEILNYNEVGYRSVHYVAKLNTSRSALPEYRRLDAPFEIQVRTILQHAWAEIEHDRNYKFDGNELPEHAQIKRRFALLAANLESADREFDAIVRDIDLYSNQVTEGAKSGNLNIPIDSISLFNYLTNKFEPILEYVSQGFGISSKNTVNELLKFGIKELSDLDDLINKFNVVEKVKELEKDEIDPLNFTGLMRRVMIITDQEKYFKQVYDGLWRVGHEDNNFIKFLEEYGIEMKSLERLGLIFHY